MVTFRIVDQSLNVARILGDIQLCFTIACLIKSWAHFIAVFLIKPTIYEPK